VPFPIGMIYDGLSSDAPVTRPSCKSLAMSQRRHGLLDLQIVTGMTPSSRGKLPTPETPQDCPAEVWDLVQQCLLLKPEERPSAKEVSKGQRLSGSRHVLLVLGAPCTKLQH
jgi:hypothetical protein